MLRRIRASRRNGRQRDRRCDGDEHRMLSVHASLVSGVVESDASIERWPSPTRRAYPLAVWEGWLEGDVDEARALLWSLEAVSQTELVVRARPLPAAPPFEPCSIESPGDPASVLGRHNGAVLRGIRTTARGEPTAAEQVLGLCR
jgi:hypothetical protein